MVSEIPPNHRDCVCQLNYSLGFVQRTKKFLYLKNKYFLKVELDSYHHYDIKGNLREMKK
jgi:hypothetical protein